MFDWFFTPNNTSSKVIAITIGTIKYCYNNFHSFTFFHFTNWKKLNSWKKEWNDWLNDLISFQWVKVGYNFRYVFIKSFNCIYFILSVPFIPIHQTNHSIPFTLRSELRIDWWWMTEWRNSAINPQTNHSFNFNAANARGKLIWMMVAAERQASEIYWM